LKATDLAISVSGRRRKQLKKLGFHRLRETGCGMQVASLAVWEGL
jgi:hypothetical protein